jgi:hypothetical protein
MYQKLLLKTALLLLILFTKSQVFPQAKRSDIISDTIAKITVTDFDLPKSTAIDSNSNAVVISNVGSVEFVGNDDDWVSYVYKKKNKN